MKNNMIKFAFAIITLGTVAHAQSTKDAKPQQPHYKYNQYVRNANNDYNRVKSQATYDWIQFKSKSENLQKTTDTIDAKRRANIEYSNAMADSANWIKCTPKMDTLPIINEKTR